MSQYICEAWVDRDGRGVPIPGEWLPVDGEDWGTRDHAIDIAAAWEADGYTTRIKRRPE